MSDFINKRELMEEKREWGWQEGAHRGLATKQGDAGQASLGTSYGTGPWEYEQWNVNSASFVW